MKTKRPVSSNPDPESASREINAILATAPKDHRAALQRIRKFVKKAVPDAVEAISYGLPAFRYKGKPLAGYASYKAHCSFFPMSGSLTGKFAKELKDFKTSKGGVQFQPEQPIPDTILKKLILARKAEIDKRG